MRSNICDEMDNKVRYVLQWADNNLILGQRLSEWCGHGPVLEQDIALTNIALDLIGEARLLYQYAASLENKDEDYYPFLRYEHEFYNVILVEQANEDWAHTIVRQFLFDNFHYHFLQELSHSTDSQLAAIATKCVKESRYHLRYSSEWLIRLGDGTEESHLKMQEALNKLYRYYNESFTANEIDQAMLVLGVAGDLTKIRNQSEPGFNKIINEATLIIPDKVTDFYLKGKSGSHSEHMGYILSTLQYMQRSYPSMAW